MTTDARTTVVDAIVLIAPDVDPARLRDTDDLHDDLGLDSVDFLAVVTAVHERTGIDVPEHDYPQITTVGAFAAYVAEHGAGA